MLDCIQGCLICECGMFECQYMSTCSNLVYVVSSVEVSQSCSGGGATNQETQEQLWSVKVAVLLQLPLSPLQAARIHKNPKIQFPRYLCSLSRQMANYCSRLGTKCTRWRTLRFLRTTCMEWDYLRAAWESAYPETILSLWYFWFTISSFKMCQDQFRSSKAIEALLESLGGWSPEVGAFCVRILIKLQGVSAQQLPHGCRCPGRAISWSYGWRKMWSTCRTGIEDLQTGSLVNSSPNPWTTL